MRFFTVATPSSPDRHYQIKKSKISRWIGDRPDHLTSSLTVVSFLRISRLLLNEKASSFVKRRKCNGCGLGRCTVAACPCPNLPDIDWTIARTVYSGFNMRVYCSHNSVHRRRTEGKVAFRMAAFNLNDLIYYAWQPSPACLLQLRSEAV